MKQKRGAGFNNPRDAKLRIPVYVSDTMDDALKTPKEGLMFRYESAMQILQNMVASGQATLTSVQSASQNLGIWNGKISTVAKRRSSGHQI